MVKSVSKQEKRAKEIFVNGVSEDNTEILAKKVGEILFEIDEKIGFTDTAVVQGATNLDSEVYI